MQIKVGRGQKLCRSCNTINGVRSFNCKNCNHPFAMKKDKKNPHKVNVSIKANPNIITDHTKLIPGDRIKVLKASGPYHTDENGNKHYIGNKGKYLVDKILDNGIMAVTQFGSHEFLYMGPEMKSPELETLTRAPYKMVLMKKRENIDE